MWVGEKGYIYIYLYFLFEKYLALIPNIYIFVNIYIKNLKKLCELQLQIGPFQ